MVSPPHNRAFRYVGAWEIGRSEGVMPSDWFPVGTIGMILNDNTLAPNQWIVLVGEKKYHMDKSNIEIMNHE